MSIYANIAGLSSDTLQKCCHAIFLLPVASYILPKQVILASP